MKDIVTYPNTKSYGKRYRARRDQHLNQGTKGKSYHSTDNSNSVGKEVLLDLETLGHEGSVRSGVELSHLRRKQKSISKSKKICQRSKNLRLIMKSAP